MKIQGLNEGVLDRFVSKKRFDELFWQKVLIVGDSLVIRDVKFQHNGVGQTGAAVFIVSRPPSSSPIPSNQLPAT